MDVYVMDEDQFRRLQQVAADLCGGSDKERDKGNTLYALIWQIREQKEERPG